jgi:hypothetical protein
MTADHVITAGLKKGYMTAVYPSDTAGKLTVARSGRSDSGFGAASTQSLESPAGKGAGKNIP